MASEISPRVARHSAAVTHRASRLPSPLFADHEPREDVLVLLPAVPLGLARLDRVEVGAQLSHLAPAGEQLDAGVDGNPASGSSDNGCACSTTVAPRRGLPPLLPTFAVLVLVASRIS